jgi:hypothetical protein
MINNSDKDESIRNKKTNVKEKFSPSLNQGIKFKKYQNKIENSLEKNAIEISGKEGYSNINTDNTSTPSLSQQTKSVISQNNYSSQQQNIDNLRQEYQDTLQQYQNVMDQINGNITGYINRTNPTNPYLNKVISFTSGEVCYVTNQGIVKYIPSPEIWQSLNISQTIQMNLDIPWSNTYNSAGTQIPTTPPLISGTPLISGQSVGGEGSNVFVNEFLPSNVNPTYMGCYASNNSNDNMSFIGGSPPSLTGALITNGNFSQPVLKNNSYIYYTNSVTVPGWYFNAVLVNNSSAWTYPTPYPGGNQCASIQNTQNMNCTLTLSLGVNYTITFSACSRACCNSTNVGNPINIQLYTTDNAFISTVANFTPSPVNSWQNFTYTFTVPTTQSYKLYFSGTNTNGDQSTAITNISLNSAITSGGTYSYDDCKQAAISTGYQYFGLQNANTTTGLGYCAVSNSQPSVTQYGESEIPSKSVSLWSSSTDGNSGNTATLSDTGSLQVLNSSEQAVYSTPSDKANPPNYLGCYGDKKNRAMSLHKKGKQAYDLSGCLQIAQDGGYQYYGLQNSRSGTNAQCALSNNISQTMKYGRATNCTQVSDGSWSGGGWSNAVYNTNDPQSNYYLTVHNNGNLTIHRGTSPLDNQGEIWTSNTKGQAQAKNPAMSAKNGKYGKHWIQNGQTLSPGDFVGSPSGKTALVMQTDGNLVLYTYEMVTNCQTMSDNNMGGGVGGNAIYDIGKTPLPQNMGKIAYIDADSNLYTYPSNNIQYNNNYKNPLKGFDTWGNDIPGAAFGNATVESCQTACNNNSSCAGFVTNAAGDYCWPKTSGMYPFGGSFVSNSDRNIYIRNRQPSSPPMGVSQNTSNTDTITYTKYTSKGAVGSQYGLPNLTSVQQQILGQLQDKMNSLSNSISGLTTNFQMGTQSVEDQSNKNQDGINNYLTDMDNTKVIINNLLNDNNIQNILNDSDIVVLQKNYSYLFWSILAAGTVLISMNIVKK